MYGALQHPYSATVCIANYDTTMGVGTVCKNTKAPKREGDLSGHLHKVYDDKGFLVIKTAQFAMPLVIWPVVHLFPPGLSLSVAY